ncbi:universal stress protein [Bythopirellula polymerisocia]|uniref:Universal stress protein E n=1 Tax=Bythopirellula polymerisocia TaxID=2528003 RepID=A0A5C6CMI4_9BACT|nr:universal stress protein [Bythopirellula polymerisocia]TWU24787.1 Universal stress protein E [Bythopirellula polymerisocia]
MKRFRKILVVADRRHAGHPLVVKAAEIARHNDASLKIVDVAEEFPWTVRLTLKGHEQIREGIIEEKRQELAELAASMRKLGLNVESEVLLGKASVQVIREVIRSKYDLVIAVAKGSESVREGFFGSMAMRLLRKCPSAVLLADPDSSLNFKHVVGCVNTSLRDQQDIELNNAIFELASSISKYCDGRFSIVHAWSIYGERILMKRMLLENFNELTQNSSDQAKRLLDKFLQRHGSTARASNVHILKGETSTVISEFVHNQEVDLVVMGTVASSGIAGVIMGNTAEQIINRIRCSVLALKPSAFVSPIRVDD